MQLSDCKLYTLQNVTWVELDDERHTHGEYLETHTCFFVPEGSGLFYCDGIKSKLKAKTMVYGQPGSIIDVRAESGDKLQVLEVSFDIWDREMKAADKAVYVINRERALPCGIVPLAAPDVVMTQAKELERLWDCSDSKEWFLIDAKFKQLLHYIAKKPIAELPDHELASRIQYSIEYVEQHYWNQVTRPELAGKIGFTPEYFSAAFKKVTGTSFSDYLTKVRIDKAKEKLLLPGRSLDQIAHEVGYKDGMYLSRKFKQVVGVSPRIYTSRPKRIIALNYLGHLLALGLKPAGTTTKLLHALPYKDRLAGVKDVDTSKSLSQIAALEPDLIVTSRPNYEQLSEIATTISIPWGQEDILEQLRYLGGLLDREKEAEAWIDSFVRKEELAARQVSGAVGSAETAAVYEVWADRIWAVNAGYGRGTRNLYRTFGFIPPEPLAPHVMNPGIGLELSIDSLAGYAADHMFITVWNERGGDKRARSLMTSEEWAALPAVKNGNVYPIDLELFKYNDPIALEQQLDIQVKLLTKVHGTSHNRK